ncbi:OsmC family protein [Aurantivibrio plasticivorans]
MKALPHHYTASSKGNPEDNLITQSDALPSISVAAPADFDGPGDQWSPETLLMASVANCFVLSFRAVANAMQFQWLEIECKADGVLDKVDRSIQFTDILTTVSLTIPSSVDTAKAEKVLEKSHRACLISNSLSCETRLEFTLHHAD